MAFYILCFEHISSLSYCKKSIKFELNKKNNCIKQMILSIHIDDVTGSISYDIS